MTRQPRGSGLCGEPRKIAAMPHSSDSSDSSFSRSPPPGKQVEYFFASLLPSDSPMGVARRGTGFLVLPRE